MSVPGPRLHERLGGRGAVLLSLVVTAVLAFLVGGPRVEDLVPGEQGTQVLRGFLSAALQPALHYEGEAPSGAPSLLRQTAIAARRTLVFAFSAMGLGLCAAVPLGFLASIRFWGAGRRRLGPGRTAAVFAARSLVLAMRSVHELLWAVLFLAAFGLSDATAVLAIAVPYAGGLAKVFAEMMDEAPGRALDALLDAGANRSSAFLVGLWPLAAPDMAAYAFYRFECAVRASAVLGFFGFPTLGYHLKQAFDNVHFRETWTYLYALLALVLVLEAWSVQIRRRLVV